MPPSCRGGGNARGRVVVCRWLLLNCHPRVAEMGVRNGGRGADLASGDHSKAENDWQFTGKNMNGAAKKQNGYIDPLLGCYDKAPTVEEEYPCLDWSGFDRSKESFEECSLLTSICTYFGFYILIVLGFINQLLFTPNVATEKFREGYAPLYNSFDQFYSRYVYRRIRDCWNKPICSTPGAEILLKDRVTDDHGWTFRFTGTTTKCINLGSYNYLGFASGEGACAEASAKTARELGLSLHSSRAELGSIELHSKLEATTAEFVGAEDAIVFGMGFGTNSLNLPAILDPNCLVLSDEKNHASLILGLRLSKATIRVFEHNNPRHLEHTVREAIIKGRNRSNQPYKPWSKIMIVVEGVYSMEGSVVHLPAIVAIKKRYRCYLYLDEAHSIGAMGPRGRGVTDFYGVDPRDVDVLMGTFTKSFGSAGGYIAGSKKLVELIRASGHGHTYAHSMSPPVAQQILTSMEIIMGRGPPETVGDGAARIASLAENTRYFRRRLQELGVITFGHEDSPVVPMLVYKFSKIGAVVRSLSEEGVAVVGVGFPATPLMQGRIRFCISAAHTRDQLDLCLARLEKAACRLGLRYSRLHRPLRECPYPDTDEPVPDL